MPQNAASRIFVLSGDELIVQAEHEDEQDDEGQTIGQVAAHPVVHLEAFAGVDFLLRDRPALIANIPPVNLAINCVNGFL